MKFANEYPLYRLLIPFVSGIILSYYFPSSQIYIYSLAFAFVVFCLWIFRPIKLRKYSWRFISGLLINILFILFGHQLLLVKSENTSAFHYSKLENVSHFIVTINSPIIEKEKSNKAVVKIKSAYIKNDSIPHIVNGNLLLYFKKVDHFYLQYGDELLIANNLDKIKGLGNPNEFDFAKYLRQQNIFHQSYLLPTDWIKTDNNNSNFIIKWSLLIREELLLILKEFDFTEPEFAVASAILLGYDEFLDSDIRQMYAGSGAMHILCVSGLHVGIIFLMFNTLLAFIKKIKYGHWVHAFMIILVIWMYAVITGLSPSVFRSATMFSFITFGGIMNRKTSTYNSLAASAFVLLIYNPYLLFHIGFQLSYLAVLSILFIQPKLSGIFNHRRWIVYKTRDLIAVSIAAQLGTFPLAIYYFHIFPNYFILTNILVIPLSFVVLFSGFANIFIHVLGLGTSYMGMLITKALYYTLWILNNSLSKINDFPFAVSEDLYFTIADTILVYLAILFITLTIIYRRSYLLVTSLSILILLFGINTWLIYKSSLYKELIIYNIPKHSLIDIFSHQKSFVFADSSLLNDETTIERYLYNVHLSKRVKEESHNTFNALNSLQSNYFSNSENLISFQGRNVFIIDEELKIPDSKNISKMDFLLIRNNPRLSLYKLLSKLEYDTLIIDASNSYWKSKKWKEECDSLNISHWDTKEKGAFILKAPSYD